MKKNKKYIAVLAAAFLVASTHQTICKKQSSWSTSLGKIVVFPMAAIYHPFAIRRRTKKYEPYKAPEHIQELALKIFKAKIKNDNFLKKALAKYKIKMEHCTVYQGVEKEIDKEKSDAIYISYFGGIHFPAGTFTKESSPSTKTIISLVHELEHTRQDTIFLNQWLLSNKYKNEYEAEKAQIKTFCDLNMQKEINVSLYYNINRMIVRKMITEGAKEKHPYMYGFFDGLFELYQPQDITKWCQKIFSYDYIESLIKKDPEKLTEAHTCAEEFFEELKNWKQAKNWKERYKEYQQMYGDDSEKIDYEVDHLKECLLTI